MVRKLFQDWRVHSRWPCWAWPFLTIVICQLFWYSEDAMGFKFHAPRPSRRDKRSTIARIQCETLLFQSEPLSGITLLSTISHGSLRGSPLPFFSFSTIGNNEGEETFKKLISRWASALYFRAIVRHKVPPITWKYLSIGLVAILAAGFTFPQAFAHVTNSLSHNYYMSCRAFENWCKMSSRMLWSQDIGNRNWNP